MVVATPPTELSTSQLSELAWWTRPERRSGPLEALLAEIATYQRRLPDGERKLRPLLGSGDPRLEAGLRKWQRLRGAYEWAVEELGREYGMAEPEIA